MTEPITNGRASISTPVLASGEQVQLSSGSMRLTVVTVGGGLRELWRGDWAVLDGYAADELPEGAYGQPLIPWPNRLRDGAYEFEGQHHQVPLTEPAKHNAIHGFSRWMRWDIAEHEPSRAVLTLLIHPRAGYPFALHVAVEYSVTDDGVTVRTTATNIGRRALPYANGFHPYITVGTGSIDDCHLEVPAASRFVTDERGIPVAQQPVAHGEYDFRSSRPIGRLQLDDAFSQLRRDEDGLARVRLHSPDGSRVVTVWLDEGYPFVELFSGDTLPDATRHRRSLGVEPMSAAPNAFQTGDGLRVLQPEESWTTNWGMQPAERSP